MAIETGTVQFEKYNGGNAYRTGFFTFYSFGSDDFNVESESNLFQVKMYTKETDITVDNTIKIRSCEIYIDKDSYTDGLKSLAKVADSTITDATELENYDLKADYIKILPTVDSDGNPIICELKAVENTDDEGNVTGYRYNLSDSNSDSKIKVTNVDSEIKKIKIVFVCDVE